jgi:2-polyprenyl-6-methoxyphenol hydroxylase-like FAD-dependent oxidoreductase
MAAPLDIIVVGGGIGGCAAAMALHKAGCTGVRIIEAVTDVQPLGVGINLQASGVLALHELGLRAQLEATAIQTRQLNYYTAEGRLIISDPRGLHAGYKVPQYSIHRGHLQMILFDAAKATLGADRVEVGNRAANSGRQGGPLGLAIASLGFPPTSY